MPKVMFILIVCEIEKYGLPDFDAYLLNGITHSLKY
jgi:hypothetical protein